MMIPYNPIYSNPVLSHIKYLKSSTGRVLKSVKLTEKKTKTPNTQHVTVMHLATGIDLA